MADEVVIAGDQISDRQRQAGDYPGFYPRDEACFYDYMAIRHTPASGLVTSQDGSPQMDRDDHNAVSSPNFGDDNLFERVWFTPLLIEAGLISEQTEHTISVWNAFQDEIKIITNIDEDDPEGTTVSPKAVPYYLPRTWFKDFTVTVLKDGPATQYTIYGFTIGGSVYNCVISGKRLVAMVIEPNWAEGVTLEFAFSTSMTKNRFFKEQRRPLLEDSNRTLTYSGYIEGLEGQKAKADLIYGHDKVFAIPCVTEPLIPSGVITGETTLTFSTDFTYYWNLRNRCELLLILDYANRITEVKGISAINTPSEIVLERAVVETFAPATTAAYPVILSVMTDGSFEDEAFGKATVGLEFMEVKGVG